MSRSAPPQSALAGDASRSELLIADLARAGLAAALVAVGLGSFSWWVDQLSWFGIVDGSWEYAAFEVLQWFGNGPTLWLLGAFVVGLAAGPRPWRGLVLGTLALVGAVLVYYGLIVAADTRPGAGLAPALVAWVAVAAVAGPVMGVAGSLSRDRRPVRRILGLSVIGGALIAMGLFIRWESPLASVPHLVAGAAVALLAPTGWQVRTLAATIGIGVVGFGLTQVAFLAVQEMLRP